MTASLSVELTLGPIECTSADVAIVTFFAVDRPLRGNAGRADWRLCGRLSHLIVSGRLGGGRGEAALVPTRGAMQAPLLVAIGLGRREGFDSRDWQACAHDAVARALKLRASVVALPLCEADLADLTLRTRAEALLSGAAAALADLGGDLHLRLIPPGPEIRRASQALRSARPRGLPRSVALRLPSAAIDPLQPSPPPSASDPQRSALT